MAKMCMLYFFLYCPHGIIYPMTGQYLTSIGFSGTQVGIVTSMGTGCAIFAGMIWGQIYANSKNKRLVIVGMCLACAVLGVLSIQTRIFIIYALLYAGIFFFFGPLYGLCDAMVLDNKGLKFPVIRSFGSFGYAVAVFSAGYLAESAGLDKMFYIFSAAYILTCPFILTEAEPVYYKEEKEEKIKVSVLLREKRYLKFVVITFFIQGTCMAHGTYFSFLFQEGGGNMSGIGRVFLLMAIAEGGFMLLLPWLLRRFSQEKLILTAISVSALRFAFFATGPSASILTWTFLIHGVVNGILMAEMVRYSNDIVPAKYRSVAVSVFYAITNLSGIVCSLLGGILLDVSGARGIYVFFCIFNVAAAALYVFMGFQKKNEIIQKI